MSTGSRVGHGRVNYVFLTLDGIHSFPHDVIGKFTIWCSVKTFLKDRRSSRKGRHACGKMELGNDPNNVFFGGIDFTLPGNGGQECVNFLSYKRRILESFLALALSCFCISFGYRHLVFPKQSKIIKKDRGGKRLLLVILCLVFGLEIGFKCATRSLIFLLNPCHVTTAIQVNIIPFYWVYLLISFTNFFPDIFVGCSS